MTQFMLGLGFSSAFAAVLLSSSGTAPWPNVAAMLIAGPYLTWRPLVALWRTGR